MIYSTPEYNNNITKKFLLVFNPVEGRVRARKRLQEVVERLYERDCCFEIIESKFLPARKDLKTFDCVVAVGGDGTVLSVVSVTSRYGIKLGIIPCGTANLFAAGLSIPTNIDKAIDILFDGRTSAVDIGMAGEKYFALRVGVGYDADIVGGASTIMKDKLGYLAYLIQGIKSSFCLRLKKMKITIDGETFDVKANSVIVANSANMFRNMVSIAPHCSTNDGKLDVFILMSKNFGDFVQVLWQIITGKHHTTSSVIYGQGRNIKIEAVEAANSHIDGEPLKNKSFDIRVIPKALKVLVPTPLPAPAFEKVLVEA
jgi:diacylglycerol kinase (ATP)